MRSSAGDGSFPLIGVDRNSPLLLRVYVRQDTQGVGSVTFRLLPLFSIIYSLFDLVTHLNAALPCGMHYWLAIRFQYNVIITLELAKSIETGGV